MLCMSRLAEGSVHLVLDSSARPHPHPDSVPSSTPRPRPVRPPAEITHICFYQHSPFTFSSLPTLIKQNITYKGPSFPFYCNPHNVLNLKEKQTGQRQLCPWRSVNARWSQKLSRKLLLQSWLPWDTAQLQNWRQKILNSANWNTFQFHASTTV